MEEFGSSNHKLALALRNVHLTEESSRSERNIPIKYNEITSSVSQIS